MRFNEAHRNHPGFKAVKWLIEKSKITTNEKTVYNDNGVEIPTTDVFREFKGKIPHVMESSLYDLAALGYKHPTAIETIINISWTSNNNGKYKEHSVVIDFPKRQVRFLYKVFEYETTPSYVA
ncbi:MAG: hypothetical protein ACKPBB_11350 [Sphaerospermopsis kisseleviana]